KIGHNVWTKQLEERRGEGIEVLSGRVDSKLFDEYSAITMDLFEANDDTIPKFNRNLLTVKHTDHEIMILKKYGKPVGTACFVVHEGTCWLFGGSIYPEFRRQGFWKFLVAERQRRSLEYGAKVWFLQTVVENIRRKSDYYFELDCYLKSKA